MPSLDRFARLWSLEPALKHHHWADPEFIARLLGISASRPVAEAWFGAHPDGPATARCRNGRASPLDALIDAQPEAWLGSELSDRFGTLPYLFKVLAAGRPLSIQVHPGPAEAVVGFGQEEAEGVARGDPRRVYKDARHKPELFLALTEAHALCGFRPYEDMATQLAALPELHELVPSFSPDSEGLRQALNRWFAQPPEVVSTALRKLLHRLEREAPEDARSLDDPARWALYAERTLGFETPDRGLLFVFLLEIVHMSPGEGIYLDAGVPHALPHGFGRGGDGELGQRAPRWSNFEAGRARCLSRHGAPAAGNPTGAPTSRRRQGIDVSGAGRGVCSVSVGPVLWGQGGPSGGRTGDAVCVFAVGRARRGSSRGRRARAPSFWSSFPAALRLSV